MRKLGKLWTHFQSEGVTEELWVLKWFMTLFTCCFDIQVVARVWDYFLVKGKKALYKTGLAMLKLLEKELLRLDLAGICQLLNSLATRSINVSFLLETICRTHLCSRELRKLERNYLAASPMHSFRSAETKSSSPVQCHRRVPALH